MPVNCSWNTHVSPAVNRPEEFTVSVLPASVPVKVPLKSGATRRERDGATRAAVRGYLSCNTDGIACGTLCGTTEICSALTRDVHRGR